MSKDTAVVHITHEAVSKIGGIGAVLDGLFTSNAYLEAVGRSILVSPLFSSEGSIWERLGTNGEVLYSSIDGLTNNGYASVFQKIENHFNVGIIYGRRTFTDGPTGVTSSPEILLIDVRHMDKGPVNHFKKQLFEHYGIRSHLYENLWEYEQYVRLALPTIAALKAIGVPPGTTTIISHEFMGMPTVLAAILDTAFDFKTAFYAHEVATMRRIVESHPGHDTMFYNVIGRSDHRLHVTEVFGDQSDYFKHPLIEASKHCDAIYAVGDHVVNELKFLAPEFETANINTVYNGIPAYKISAADKLASKEKLCKYCENLLGYKPDFIFTHVARLVRSKAFWRDLRVLEHIEKEFRAQGKTGVLYLLSTEVSQRRSHDIHAMEAAYNWPVAHREGWPDLSGGEATLYAAIQEFNARNRNIKIIFVNQFGFSRENCGSKMPENMEFMDIRKGSDVEFGQSIYEPFGIAMLEPLTFGAICVLSSVCGCAGFVRDTAGLEDIRNVIIADYTDTNGYNFSDIEDLLQIDQTVRDQVEHHVSEKVAMQICSRLAKNISEVEELVESGYRLAQNMSWDAVVKNYLLGSLEGLATRQQNAFIMTN